MFRRPAIGIALGMLVMITRAVQAQTPPPPIVPWPPDPATIFADGIDWEVVPPPPTATIPPPAIDNENRVIRVYHTVNSWTDYPFPEGITQLYEAIVLPDGRIRVQLDQYRAGIDWTPADAALILDPATRVYAAPPLVCDGMVVQEPDSWGRWIPLQPPGTDRGEFICHTATGEIIDSLPDGDYSWVVSPSPDGRWLVLAGANRDRQIDVFGYEFATEEWITLGVIDLGGDQFGFGDWVGSTKGTLTVDSRVSGPATLFYAFDVTQPGSLQYIFGVWYDDLFSLPDRPGYAAFFAAPHASYQSGTDMQGLECALTIYDAQGVRRHTLAYNCLPVATGFTEYAPTIRIDDTLYYLTTDRENAIISALRRFDLVTETGNAPLWIDEIEAILSVSPDHRYVALLIDDNGVLDKGFRDCCRKRGGWQVLVVDSERHKPVYLSEPMGVYLPQQAVWLDSSTLVIYADNEVRQVKIDEEGDVQLMLIPASLRRIEINESGIEVQSTTRFGSPRRPDEFGRSLSPDRRYALFGSVMVDLLTFERHPILRDDLSPAYIVKLGWSEDCQLQANISSDAHPGQSIVYRLTLPQ